MIRKEGFTKITDFGGPTQPSNLIIDSKTSRCGFIWLERSYDDVGESCAYSGN
jgi:hypothetical protein